MSRPRIAPLGARWLWSLLAASVASRSIGHATLHDDQTKSHRADDRHYRRHLASLAASIAAHAALIGAIVFFAPRISKPHGDWVLAYLVEIGEGSAGGGRSARSSAGSAATVNAETGPVAMPRPTTIHRDRVRVSMRRREELSPHRDDRVDEIASHTPAPKAPPIDAAMSRRGSASGEADAVDRGKLNRSGADPPGFSGIGDGTGSGSGIGTGGGGGGRTALAHADYGTNPAPIYPAIARRHEEQGTVTLRVLVGADGRVERVEISDSSGYDALDDSAVETVAKKWRFEPAHRDGVAFESWVLVPIRFALTEANSGR
ncbi:MAG: energy transducer TonB [Candidatus Binatus sp.]|uniref:energy transducer TonB n=1 Tax=Candidatus Binatus sp. TaxID=2811406 RepID=UPI00271E2DF8|nr:energy transducer TonB [Candidatus Binatus sp.]MDO8434706.1 energy transducer TonB [Candidatus Binatus sp.]